MIMIPEIGVVIIVRSCLIVNGNTENNIRNPVKDANLYPYLFFENKPITVMMRYVAIHVKIIEWPICANSRISNSSLLFSTKYVATALSKFAAAVMMKNVTIIVTPRGLSPELRITLSQPLIVLFYC